MFMYTCPIHCDLEPAIPNLGHLFAIWTDPFAIWNQPVPNLDRSIRHLDGQASDLHAAHFPYTL